MKNDFEKRSKMITINLRKRLYDIRCAENGNIHTHFNNIQTMQEELASLGTELSEPDFSAIILGLLPKTYDQFLSAVTTTTSMMKQELNPKDLMQTIIDEFDCRSTRSGALKEKSSDVAFFAGGTNNWGKRNWIGMLNATTATRKGIRNLIAGVKEEERRGKALGQGIGRKKKGRK